MEKQVMIHIKGTQKPEHEPEQVMEFITAGKLHVSYEESDLIGMNGVTTAFVVNEGMVSMERTGRLNSKMRFVEGQRTESLYSLDVGAMLLGITARRVETDLTEDGGSIYLEYSVELEHMHLGLNTYHIQVKPVEEGEETEDDH